MGVVVLSGADCILCGFWLDVSKKISYKLEVDGPVFVGIFGGIPLHTVNCPVRRLSGHMIRLILLIKFVAEEETEQYGSFRAVGEFKRTHLARGLCQF